MAEYMAAGGSRLQFGDLDLDQRKAVAGLQADDLPRIEAIRTIVERKVDAFTSVFFDRLKSGSEAEELLRAKNLFEEARRRKREHLLAMVGGIYDDAYAQQRVKLALLYSRAGIATPVFLGAFHELMHTIGQEVMGQSRAEAQTAFECFMSLNKVGFFDIGIIIDVMIDESERVISAQQNLIRELSTPVLQVRDRLLVLPIIGIIDTQRAKQLTDSLLQAIRANRAKMVVMDITGVAAVDSKVANHLIQTVAAARLMGAHVIVTGLSADVAQSLVALGVDLSRIRTVGDLQGGLEEAEAMLGYRIVPIPERRALPERF